MQYIHQIGGVIYVTIPGMRVKEFKKSHAATAQDYHDRKCRELGIAPLKPETPILPKGLTIRPKDGTRYLVAQLSLAGKRKTKWYCLEKWPLQEAIELALEWRYMMEEKR